MMKKITRILTGLLTAAMLLSGCQKQNTETTEFVIDPAVVTDVMSSANYIVTNKQFMYFYMSAYQKYSAYASYFGFSTDIPLDEQEYTMSNLSGYTWHDYLVDETKKSLKELLVLCEAARQRGITLDEAEKEDIEANIKALNAAAGHQGIDTSELISKNYGLGVTEFDVRYCLELQKLAIKAKEVIKAELVFTDEDLEKTCADNMNVYYDADYRYYEFRAEIGTDFNANEIKEAKAQAKANADKLLAQTKDEQSFLDGIESYLRSETDMTDEEIEAALEATLSEEYAYKTGGEFSDWLFEQDDEGNYIRKKGDVTNLYNDENGSYTICVVVRPIYREDYATRSVRHILISVDTFDGERGLPDAQAKAKAEALLEELKTAEKTEEAFAAMAAEHSMDTDSAKYGGLYENIGRGNMIAEFDRWLYDDSRTVGEMDIVLTKYGYHITYYVGEGPIKWKIDAEANLRNETYVEEYEALTQEYKITVNEQGLRTIISA